MPLVDDLEQRSKHDHDWGFRNFFVAQTFLWLAVVSSFGSSIAAAFQAPAWVVAVVAAIPGAVILVDRSFSFASRARWHYMLSTNTSALARALKYEGGSEKEISQKFSELMKSSEENYPRLDGSGLSHPSQPSHNPKPHHVGVNPAP